MAECAHSPWSVLTNVSKMQFLAGSKRFVPKCLVPITSIFDVLEFFAENFHRILETLPFVGQKSGKSVEFGIDPRISSSQNVQ